MGDSMSCSQPARGLMGLPVELRFAIYGFLLPEDGIIDFPTRRQSSIESKALLALCETDDRISEEVQTETFRSCHARLSITPDRELKDLNIQWHQFQSIDIQIKYYDPAELEISDWKGMKQLVRLLQHGQPKILPDLLIKFRQDDTSAFFDHGDPRWTTAEDVREAHATMVWPDLDDHGDGNDALRAKGPVRMPGVARGPANALLRTGRSNDSPVTVEILEHLLVLPPCRSAVVQDVKLLKRRSNDSTRYDPERQLFDNVYMQDLWKALELWLMGKREGVEVDSEPRLAQLAYSRYGGELYCDQ